MFYVASFIVLLYLIKDTVGDYRKRGWKLYHSIVIVSTVLTIILLLVDTITQTK